jgi:hypothetical protein
MIETAEQLYQAIEAYLNKLLQYRLMSWPSFDVAVSVLD